MILPHPPVIHTVHGPRSIAEYDTAEYVLDVDAAYRNPFDPEEIAVDAYVTSPTGKRLDIPGFLYQPFRRTVGKATLPIAIPNIEDVRAGKHAPTQTFDDAEIVIPNGKPSWRVRFAPTEPGLYKLTFSVRTPAGTSKTNAELRSTKAPGGFVRVSKRDPRYFALDDGTSLWPIGENLGWAGGRGLKDYEAWIPDLAKSGANWARFWLSPQWTTFGLVQNDASKIDLGNAWRLDQAMSLAQKNGVKVDLCIDSYNVLRDRVAWPEWERSALNKANGGPLAKPSDFWTDPIAARLYRNRLRYIVARWGSNSSTMAWEFWNEVDGVADYRWEPIRDWHRKMAHALKSIDPYHHLVTTSFGGDGEKANDRQTFDLKEIDFAQSHRYGDPDLALGIVHAQNRLGNLSKPHFVGEVGADSSGDRRADDPTGIQIHDALWASLASGSAGSAMTWWWDSYVAPLHLYPLFTPVARFIKGIEFDREAFHPVQPILAPDSHLVAVAMVGKTTAIAWLRNQDATWLKQISKGPLTPNPSTTVTIPNLKPGRWSLEIWNTRTGMITSRQHVKVTSDGQAQIKVPSLKWDQAIKLKLEPM